MSLKDLLQGQAMIVMLQALLALMFAGVICYLYIAGRPVPADLVNVLLIIIGFFFGERVGVARQTGYRDATAERLAALAQREAERVKAAEKK